MARGTRSELPGPIRANADGFDVLSDVHGCVEELEDLLRALRYRSPEPGHRGWRPPRGRRLVVAGDLVDRGPEIPAVLRLAMEMVASGDALIVVGNHDDKLRRALMGRPVKVTHGLEASLEQLGRETMSFRTHVRDFLATLPSHALLDDGALVVAHAGLPERLHGNPSEMARDIAMYGPTRRGEDEWGFPVRLDWAADYTGRAKVVYGHTPVVDPVWRNGTIDIDTGCVFGGSLTAIRYPELEIVSVPARAAYQDKGSPFRIGGPGGPPAIADGPGVPRAG